MSDLKDFAAIDADDRDQVGGKGLSLGQLARAGLPVPPGFCVTTAAYRRLAGQFTADPNLQRLVSERYHALGGGAVAVRSSATAEDGAETSFAGQQDTILGVTGAEAVCSAIDRCWQSLHSERARAYRRQHQFDESRLAMAVVVQRLVPAEVAGVLFTRDPLAPEASRMLVEASWGLGESVVSGRVQPDRFQLDRATGRVLDRQLGAKSREIVAGGTAPEERAVSPERRDVFCLSEAQLEQLAQLGRTVEAHFHEPRDVEWAWAEGRFWLLQARPITAAGQSEQQRIRLEEIQRGRTLRDSDGTVWVRANLAESIPEPTPMTWSILRRHLSGRGGYGAMYRDLGFTPHPDLDDECVYDLIAGRVYHNLSRDARMQYGTAPLGYRFEALKADPARVWQPTPELLPVRGGLSAWLRLPGQLWRITTAGPRLRKQANAFATLFRQTVVPPFLAEVQSAQSDPLDRLDSPALVQWINHWIERTLIDYARHSLKPTVFAAVLKQTMETHLAAVLGPARAAAAMVELVSGVHADADADWPEGVRALTEGRISRDEFLAQFGHRGDGEMELARPRWSELPEALDRLTPPPPTAAREPWSSTWQRIAEEARLPAPQRSQWADIMQRMRDYLGLRETAKHHLLRGYALIRRGLLELDHRLGGHGDVFFLTWDDLPAWLRGENLSARIAEQRKRRGLMLTLPMPVILWSDDLEAIGRPLPIAEAEALLTGVGLSAGVAEGPALVLRDPRDAPTGDAGFILVCPSTDPAWVPLFTRARGLVMETGGVLSHGAIVAREYGLPAIAGLPDIVSRLRTGQRLRLDGSAGTLAVEPKQASNR